MIYDPNYKNQVFWDTNDFSIGEIVSKLKSEIAIEKYKTNRPASRFGKLMVIGFCVYSVLVLATLFGTFIITRSELLMLVVGLCGSFFWFGWICLYIAITRFVIIPKYCTLPIEATCIGYSLSGGGNSGSGGGFSLCPVFEYEYEGSKITAFDNVYDNINIKPSIGAKGTIFINPNEPEEIVWNKKNKVLPFLILAFLFAVVLSLAIFFIVLNDEDFMNEALKEAKLTVSSLAGFIPFHNQ